MTVAKEHSGYGVAKEFRETFTLKRGYVYYLLIDKSINQIEQFINQSWQIIPRMMCFIPSSTNMTT